MSSPQTAYLIFYLIFSGQLVFCLTCLLYIFHFTFQNLKVELMKSREINLNLNQTYNTCTKYNMMVTNLVYSLISWTLSTWNALGKNNFDGILYSFLRLLRNNKTSWCPLVCRSRGIIITFYGSVSTCKIYEFFWFISSFSVIRISNENFSEKKI